MTIYDKKILKIIYYSLHLLDDSIEQQQNIYIDGIQKIILPTNICIRKWIVKNLTF